MQQKLFGKIHILIMLIITSFLICKNSSNFFLLINEWSTTYESWVVLKKV